jgi:hypothetical protein
MTGFFRIENTNIFQLTKHNFDTNVFGNLLSHGDEIISDSIRISEFNSQKFEKTRAFRILSGTAF